MSDLERPEAVGPEDEGAKDAGGRPPGGSRGRRGGEEEVARPRRQAEEDARRRRQDDDFVYPVGEGEAQTPEGGGPAEPVGPDADSADRCGRPE